MTGSRNLAIIVALGTALAGLAVPKAGAETSAPVPHYEIQGALPEAPLDDRFRSLLADVRAEAIAAGVTEGILDTAFAQLTPDVSLRDLLVAQPEHVMAPWDYLARIVSEKRIGEGLSKLAEQRPLLDEIETKLGVDRHVVVAIWGIESSYGALPGKRSVIRSLATLAVADPRRPEFWRKELMAALLIVQRGDVAADRMWGSWAGAMGHTQFMPSSFLARAVDFDGDGRRDIWQSVPDALASTASYLKKAGWRTGEAWGLEVILPAGFEYRHAGPRELREPAAWRALGLELPVGSTWPAAVSQMSLVLPAGMHGPAFLVGANFHAILKYNNSILYALAVGQLADRLAGRPALVALWPIHDPPLDHAGRRELQERLVAEGHDVGGVDGIIGDATRNALRAWQRQRGLPADGWAGTMLLERLRGPASASN